MYDMSISGQEHHRQYEVTVKIGSQTSSGFATTKNLAKRNAASSMLIRLETFGTSVTKAVGLNELDFNVEQRLEQIFISDK